MGAWLMLIQLLLIGEAVVLYCHQRLHNRALLFLSPFRKSKFLLTDSVYSNELFD